MEHDKDHPALTADEQAYLELASSPLALMAGGVDRASFMAGYGAAEGYPGIAADLETLRSALTELLAATDAHAKAQAAAEVAANNYSTPRRELEALTRAMVRVSVAERSARAALSKVSS